MLGKKEKKNPYLIHQQLMIHISSAVFKKNQIYNKTNQSLKEGI